MWSELSWKKKMKNRTQITLLAASFALSLGLGCQRLPDNSNKKEIEELSAKIDTINDKIDKLSIPSRGRAQAPKRPTVGQLYKVPVGKDDSFRGGQNAKVTIVEATEFACPYCARLADVTEELLAAYSDEDLKIVSKQFVVHPQTATKPALASCAAHKQGKFGEFEKALWKNAWHSQDALKLKADELATPALDGIAKTIGLDMGRFHKDMEGSCKSTIASNRTQLAKLGVNGTPALYVNGVYYGGPRSVDGLKAAIDAELKKANTALAKGAKLESYYASLIAKGKTSM
jgi:protein-disulfide isomerase